MKTLVFLCVLVFSQRVLAQQENPDSLSGKDPLIVFYQKSLSHSADYPAEDSYVFGRMRLLYTQLQMGVKKDVGLTSFLHQHLLSCSDINCEQFKEVVLQTFIVELLPDSKGFALYLVNPYLENSWVTFEVGFDENEVYTRYYYSLGICLKESLSEDVYENDVLRNNEITDIEPIKVHSLHQIAFVESLFESCLYRITEGTFKEHSLCNN